MRCAMCVFRASSPFLSLWILGSGALGVLRFTLLRLSLEELGVIVDSCIRVLRAFVQGEDELRCLRRYFSER